MLLALLVGFFVLVVPAFATEFQELTTLLPQGFSRLNIWLEELRTRLPSQFTASIPDVESLTQQVQPLISGLLSRSVAFFSSSLGVLINILLVLVLTLMFLANPQPYRRVFIKLFPSFYRRRADGILTQCEQALGKWIIGALISMSVIAILSWIGLSILGVRLAFANGVIAGLLNFIPNIGPTLSVVLPISVALLDAPWKAGAVLIIYIVIQQFESNFLTPLVMAQQVSLLPAITLLAQVFFTTAFGSLGLVMSLPLTVVSQVWIKEVLVKDVLDQWNSKHTSDRELVVVSDYREVAESSELTQTQRTEVKAADEKPSVDDKTT
jgi:predicted PurR-regulated permease PerM